MKMKTLAFGILVGCALIQGAWASGTGTCFEKVSINVTGFQADSDEVIAASLKDSYAKPGNYSAADDLDRAKDAAADLTGQMKAGSLLFENIPLYSKGQTQCVYRKVLGATLVNVVIDGNDVTAKLSFDIANLTKRDFFHFEQSPPSNTADGMVTWIASVALGRTLAVDPTYCKIGAAAVDLR